MSTTVGLGVVLAILVVLPLAAVWAAGRWRDPPRERWGPSERQLREAATDPLYRRHQLRKELGLLDDRRWDAARRGVARGIAVEPALRAAVRTLAERRIARIDAALARPRQWLALGVAPVAALAVGILLLRWQDNPVGLVYSLVFAVSAVLQSPPLLRRHRARAEAALTANA